MESRIVRKNSAYIPTITNVYNTAAGSQVKRMSLRMEKTMKSPHLKIVESDGKANLIIDTDADIDDLFRSKGRAIPPDEILDSRKENNITIPVKFREDFAHHLQLPSSELLEVLHYYTSRKFTPPRRNALMRSMDETALLAFGLLVESWVDDLIDEDTARLFLTHCDEDNEKDGKENEENEEEDEGKDLGDDIEEESQEESSGSDSD